MSYYRSGQGYSYNTNGNPPQQTPNHLAHYAPGQGYAEDEQDTHPGADELMTPNSNPPWAPPNHLARVPLHERTYSEPTHTPGPRPQRLNLPSTPPTFHQGNGSETPQTPQSQYGSVLPGTYNPQDYAGLLFPSSPAQAGAPSYPSTQQILPQTSYNPNSYRHNSTPNYSNASNHQPRMASISEGIPGARHIVGSMMQPASPSLQSAQPRSTNNEVLQPQRYSPQIRNDFANYQNASSPGPTVPSGYGSFANSPSVPVRDSTRSTPSTQQYTQFSSAPNHSPNPSSLQNLSYVEPRQFGYQSFLGHSALPGLDHYDMDYNYQQEQASLSRASGDNTGLNRTGTGRHPQARPLPPGPPADVGPRNPFADDEDEDNQEDLYEEIQEVIRGPSFGSSAQSRPDQHQFQALQTQYGGPEYQNAIQSPSGDSHTSSQPFTQRNGIRSGTGSVRVPNYVDFGDDSDAEAAAGFHAMQLAADEDHSLRQDISVRSNARVDGHKSSTSISNSEDDDFPHEPYDISSLVGFDPQLSYGGGPVHLAAGTPTAYQRNHSSSWGDSITVGPDGQIDRRPSRRSGESPAHSIYAAPAQTDQYGTGGFEEPTGEGRRRSFESGDDMDYEGSEMNLGPGMPNYPYLSGSLHRPLPPVPLDNEPQYASMRDSLNTPSWQNSPSYHYPTTPESYTTLVNSSISSTTIRHSSLTSPPHTPQPRLPDRAKTDAEKRMRETKRTTSYGPENAISYQTPTSPHMGIDLPTIPAGKRFQPGKLSNREFDRCEKPWAMSSILAWLRTITAGESELKRQPLADALQMLFTNKVPNMQIADAEALAAHVVADLLAVGILRSEEEWLKFEEGSITGVLHQLTGSGCYALASHEYEFSGKCYSTSCQRIVKRLDTQEQAPQQVLDWATYYNLKAENVQGFDKKDIERQNIIHEIVTTEQQYLDDLTALQTIYRDGLQHANPPIVATKVLPEFIKQVFGKVGAVQKANADFLLPQLRYRQKEQGPWIAVISDIFRDWIRKARPAYVDYAGNYPQADYTMRVEQQKNLMFVRFCDDARNHKLSRKLAWDSFLKSPITRLQRYSLLLQTVLKTMTTKLEPEFTNLQTAVEEIRKVTMECDTRVAEQARKVDLLDLQSRLALRQEMRMVELNITQRGRELIFRGDLQRLGQNKFKWLDIHAILLDNFFILAKVSVDPSIGLRGYRYDVSKIPIPMDLLILESFDDDPVVKTTVRGYSTVASNAPRGVSAPGPGNLIHRGTGTGPDLSLALTETTNSIRTIVPSTSLERQEAKDDKVLYPFRIKHLGRESYTLYCTRIEDRRIWCDKILEAKTKHASSLFRQNAEPFSLRVLADTAFALDSSNSVTPRQTLIKGTPLSRAIEDIEQKYASAARPVPACRARVNCATTFTQQGGRQMMAVGTDYGVYTAQVGDCRNWNRTITVHRVTQISVLEEYNLMLLISEKSLIAYHLDVVCPPNGKATQDSSTRKAPQKLSGSKDVGFFAAGRMKDRTLVFYKKKDGMQSTFRILEPVLQKATERKSRLLHRGTTDFFRDYDEFYIPTECTGLELFASTLAVATSKGFEVLNLDRKTPWTVPDLKQPGVKTIEARLAGVDPLAMFRLSESEFICVYEECAIYINKHGDVSRSVVMEFVGRARSAALEAGYLILFDRDFVEIRDAQLGRLKQVIPGVEVKCLDNGRGGTSSAANTNSSSLVTGQQSTSGFAPQGLPQSPSPGLGTGGMNTRTIKFAMQHPEQDRTQIVLELVLNPNQAVSGGSTGR